MHPKPLTRCRCKPTQQAPVQLRENKLRCAAHTLSCAPVRQTGWGLSLPSRRYQAESPDEEALVYAAAQVPPPARA
jgi:hypothetical protein